MEERGDLHSLIVTLSYQAMDNRFRGVIVLSVIQWWRYREGAWKFYLGKRSLYRFHSRNIWADEARLTNVMWNFNYEHKWIVHREGRGGRLALFWKSSINLLVEDSSKYFIDTIIDKNIDNAWRFTGFYGEPFTSRCYEAWDALW